MITDQCSQSMKNIPRHLWRASCYLVALFHNDANKTDSYHPSSLSCSPSNASPRMWSELRKTKSADIDTICKAVFHFPRELTLTACKSTRVAQVQKKIRLVYIWAQELQSLSSLASNRIQLLTHMARLYGNIKNWACMPKKLALFFWTAPHANIASLIHATYQAAAGTLLLPTIDEII